MFLDSEWMSSCNLLQVSFFMTDKTLRHRRSVRAASFEDYKDLALASGGQAIQVSKSQLPKATDVILDTSTSALVRISSLKQPPVLKWLKEPKASSPVWLFPSFLQVTVLQRARSGGREETFSFMLDESLRNITVYITGSSITFTLTNPAGNSELPVVVRLRWDEVRVSWLMMCTLQVWVRLTVRPAANWEPFRLLATWGESAWTLTCSQEPGRSTSNPPSRTHSKSQVSFWQFNYYRCTCFTVTNSASCFLQRNLDIHGKAYFYSKPDYILIFVFLSLILTQSFWSV